ncbi:hypothetical protein OROMI_005079 [Orobanche minor]
MREDEGLDEGLEDVIEIPKARSGLTRLPKLRTRFTNSGGKKHKVNFDSLGRFSGEYRFEFSSFLGDLVREHVGFRYLSWKTVPVEIKHKLWDQVTYFYDIGERRRKFVVNRMGGLLRNFRRKIYARFIQPNLGKPGRLAKVPNLYRTLVDKSDWEKFVAYTQSDKFQDISTEGQTARMKHIYPHHMGRGGYSYLKEKLVKRKEITIDEDPSRAYMWRKGREDKNGEYQNMEVKFMAEKLIEVAEKIKDEALNLDPDQDAITVVFGKDRGHYLKGVGCGVTASTYWTGPKKRGESKEIIAILEQQLQNERLECEKKDAEIKTLSSQVAETNDKLNKLLTQLGLQGQLISANISKGTPTSNASNKDSTNGTKSLPIDTITPTSNASNKDSSNGTKSLGKQQLDPAVGTSNPLPKPKRLKITKKMNLSPPGTANAEIKTLVQLLQNSANVQMPMKCTLCTINLNNPVAYGQVYISTDKGQTIHGVPLQSDCCRVSIEKVIKGAAFLPSEAGEMKTVEEAHHSFVAWPQSLIKIMDPAEVPNLPVSEEEKNPTRGTRTQMTPTRTTRTCGTPTRTIPTRTTPTRTIPTRTTPTCGQKQKQPNKRIYTTRNEVIKQSQSKKKKVK